MKPFIFAALALLAGAQQPTQQKPPAAGAPKDFTLPAAKRFTLANGLPVTMVPFGQVPKAAIRLVVAAATCTKTKTKSGSRIDLHKLGPDYLSSYVKRVMAVTPDEVRRIANEYLTPDKMSLVVVGDEKTVKTQVTQWAQ
jgi:predicted Zn-dependent peptidase